MTRHIIRAATAGAAFLLTALPALAHAILVASTPAAGATVTAGPLAMEFSFNSRIDKRRSVLRIAGQDRSETQLTVEPDGSPEKLRTSADLASGQYIVHWQVLAVDGHITRGDVRFTVISKP